MNRNVKFEEKWIGRMSQKYPIFHSDSQNGEVYDIFLPFFAGPRSTF